MELEAENLWVQSTRHDFDDKQNFIKKYYFFVIEIYFFKKKNRKYFRKIENFQTLSMKFNIKSKFDTHIFNEITTRKVIGKGGLALTLQSESVTSKQVATGTGVGTSTTTIQPVLKVGDGANQGVISSL